MNVQTSSRRRRLAVAAIPLALLVSSGLVYQASTAAFTDTTATGNNTWAAGSVDISDSSSGSAVFTESGLGGGDTGKKCIKVTYGGTLAADVRLYVSASAGGLRQYLDFDVNEGTGNAADCSDFTPGTSLTSSDTLASFATAHSGWGNGASTWEPGGAGQTKTYQFTWTLQSDDAAQGLSGSATFTWEARNS